MTGLGTDYFFMTYDGDGRLSSLGSQTHVDDHVYELEYEYAPDRITVSGGGGSIYDLRDGRLIHFEGPLQLAPDDRAISEYESDQDGKLIAYNAHGQIYTDVHSVHYSYDAQGRVASVTSFSELRTISYSTTGASTSVTATPTLGSPIQAAFDVDGMGRLTRSSGTGEVTYRYTDTPPRSQPCTRTASTRVTRSTRQVSVSCRAWSSCPPRHYR